MLEIEDLRVVRDGRTILDIDHLSIPTDKLTVVLGHNGSGKSTLANVIAGLTKPESGTVMLEGVDIFSLSEKERAGAIAFLPQKLPASAGLTCRELVRLGRYPYRGLFGRWRKDDERAVDEALAATDTSRFAFACADELSGGERQRVWIGMLLAQASPLMILDEPTSALDVKHQYGVLGLLEKLNRTASRGVITIIHDINLALRYATHVVALKGGRLLFEGGRDVFADEANLRSLFETDLRLFDHPHPPAEHCSTNLKVAVVCE